MDENEIYEALGMTPPDTGGEDPGPEDTQTTPPEDDAGPGPDTGEDATADGEEDAPQAAQAPPDRSLTATDDDVERERRWEAVARQLAERAVQEERARNQAQWKDFFASAGLKNSLEDGKPITSLEEFQAWKRSYDRLKLEQELKEGKLSPETLETAIRSAMGGNGPGADVAQGPSFSGLRPTNDRPGGASAAQGPSFSGLRPANDRPGGVTAAQIDAELAEIHRLDGSVNGLEDILRLETGNAFQDAVRRGHSFLDAFKLANFDRLQARQQAETAQRAAQAARNSARSKEHLRTSSGKSGSGSVPVPGDVMEMYRLMMPKASEKEISEHYNRSLKELTR